MHVNKLIHLPSHAKVQPGHTRIIEVSAESIIFSEYVLRSEPSLVPFPQMRSRWCSGTKFTWSFISELFVLCIIPRTGCHQVSTRKLACCETIRLYVAQVGVSDEGDDVSQGQSYRSPRVRCIPSCSYLFTYNCSVKWCNYINSLELWNLPKLIHVVLHNRGELKVILWEMKMMG